MVATMGFLVAGIGVFECRQWCFRSHGIGVFECRHWCFRSRGIGVFVGRGTGVCRAQCAGRRQCFLPGKNLEPRRKTGKRVKRLCVDEMDKQKGPRQRFHGRMPIGGGAAVRRIQADQSESAESAVGRVARARGRHGRAAAGCRGAERA
eukprot:COSAG02_NODE_2989_length_7609_cov_11.207723_4_plen_149_part_00